MTAVAAEELALELKNVSVKSESVSLTFHKGPTILIGGGSAKFLVIGADMDGLLQWLDKKYSLTTLKTSSAEYQQVSKTGRPISELLWFVAFHCSSEVLLPGCQRSDVIKLKRWPNLTRLDSSENSIRIAALLSSRPTSLDLAGRILNIEKTELFRFYNAAYYSGIATSLNRKEDAFIPDQGKHNPIIPKLITYLTRKEKRAS